MTSDNLSEKVSVNINTSTLSNIDILVDNGYYSNRSDFINQALREALSRQSVVLDRIINAKTESSTDKPWFVGVFALSKSDVDAALSRGDKLKITGYGVLIVGDGIDEEDLFNAVESIKIKGKAVCSPEIKKHYGLK